MNTKMTHFGKSFDMHGNPIFEVKMVTDSGQEIALTDGPDGVASLGWSTENELEVFERLTGEGYKLNLVTGIYSKPTA